MKNIYLFLLSLTLYGCGSVQKVPFDLLVGYDYAITDNEFVKITGDFYELRYSYEMNLRMGAGYTTRNYKYGQILYLMIRTLEVHDFNQSDHKISVNSKNFGELKLRENSSDYPTLLYTIPMNFNNKQEVLEAIKGDEITIKVDDRTYRFIAPTASIEIP